MPKKREHRYVCFIDRLMILHVCQTRPGIQDVHASQNKNNALPVNQGSCCASCTSRTSQPITLEKKKNGHSIACIFHCEAKKQRIGKYKSIRTQRQMEAFFAPHTTSWTLSSKKVLLRMLGETGLRCVIANQERPLH